MKKMFNLITALIFAVALVSCGSASLDGSAVMREITATIVSSANSAVKGIDSCSKISKAVLINEEGIVISESKLSDCKISLMLEVEKHYFIGFLDESGCYVSQLSSAKGNVIHVYEGPGTLDIGTVFISPESSEFPFYVECAAAEEEDDLRNDICSIYCTCEEAGFGSSCLPMAKFLESARCANLETKIF